MISQANNNALLALLLTAQLALSSIVFQQQPTDVWTRVTSTDSQGEALSLGSQFSLFTGTSGIVELFMIHTTMEGNVQTKFEYKNRLRAILEYQETNGVVGYQPGPGGDKVWSTYTPGAWTPMSRSDSVLGTTFSGATGDGVVTASAFFPSSYDEGSRDSNSLLINGLSGKIDKIDFTRLYTRSDTYLATFHSYLLLKKISVGTQPEYHPGVEGSDEFVTMFPIFPFIDASNTPGVSFRVPVASTTYNTTSGTDPQFQKYCSFLTNDHSAVFLNLRMLDYFVPTVAQGNPTGAGPHPATATRTSAATTIPSPTSAAPTSAATSAASSAATSIPTSAASSLVGSSSSTTPAVTWRFDTLELAGTQVRAHTSSSTLKVLQTTAAQFSDRFELFLVYRDSRTNVETKFQIRSIFEFVDSGESGYQPGDQIVSRYPSTGSSFFWDVWNPPKDEGGVVATKVTANTAAYVTYNTSTSNGLFSYRGRRTVQQPKLVDDVLPTEVESRISFNYPRTQSGTKLAVSVRLWCNNKLNPAEATISEGRCLFGSNAGVTTSSPASTTLFVDPQSTSNLYYTFHTADRNIEWNLRSFFVIA